MEKSQDMQHDDDETRDSIMACTVVQTLVKADSQSYGNGQTSTPRGSEMPERISTKLGIYNYVGDLTTHANPHGAATTWVVSANTWLITCFGFLVCLFLFSLYSWDRAKPALADWFWRSIRHDVFPHKEVPFGGRDDITPHLGGQIPPKKNNFGGVNRRFQAYVAK